LTLNFLPLTREHLVEATILNAGDAQTLRYLMRCAKRFSHRDASGFLLQDAEGRPVHFLWISNYDGFRFSEIDHALEPSSTSAAMIFDCWTPSADRGRGHYATAIRQGRRTSTAGEQSSLDLQRGHQCVIVEGHSEGWVYLSLFIGVS